MGQSHTFKIRNVDLSDIPQIAKIYGYYVEESRVSFELEPPTNDEMKSRMERLLEKGYPYIVAYENKKVLGFAFAGQYKPRPAYNWTVESSIYINTDFRGRKIGFHLMETLIEKATSKGFKQMLAGIVDDNNEASFALHSKLGFEKVARLKKVGFKMNKWVDVVFMQKELGKS